MPPLPQVAISFVRILYQFWLQHGVPKQVLDEVLRVDINEEKTTKFGISSNQLASLHLAANNAVNDPLLGVRLGKYIAEENLALQNLMTYSDTLYHGLNAITEYSKAISESGYFTFCQQYNDRYVLKFIVHQGINFSNQQRDMVFSGFVAALAKNPVDWKNFVYYHYDQHAAGQCDYSKELNCQLIADEEVYLEFDTALLMAKNVNKNSNLFKKSVYEINKIILKREQRIGLYIDVTKSIQECLLEGCAQQEVVANKLDISVRNLQRRLKEVGTNYQVILDDCREALALTLIADDTLPLYEVAYKVGFNEPSAFYKAFKRWTGKRPGDFRQDAMKSQFSEASSVDG